MCKIVIGARGRSKPFGECAYYFVLLNSHLQVHKDRTLNYVVPTTNYNINLQDKRIRSAAHCAAAKGQLRVLELLQQYGASLELQNYRGDLPFHEAVQMGSQGF